MIQSYEKLNEYAKEKSSSYVNEYILVEILNLVKAPLETQLKIMSKFFKSYDNDAQFSDLMTFFVVEGFPEIETLQEGLLRAKR